MSGAADPRLYPPGVTSGNKQCIKRGKRTWCTTMQFPPFPIVSLPLDKNVFSSATWNVGNLINSTSDSLCRLVPTSAPTFAPNKLPTPQPTVRSPTRSPVEGVDFQGLDMYIFLDRSKSMRWHANVCRNAPGANRKASDSQVCWQLFLRFVETLVHNATQIRYPTADFPAFGWNADRVQLKQGIRVWIYGFACANQ
jgi:hypothetical protein